MAYLAPITELVATPRSTEVEATLMQSFVLDDIAAWGPASVESALRKAFDYNWIISVFDEYKYLIKAPTRQWLESLSSKGFLKLESVEFPIVAWDREFGEGVPLEVVWVRVYGFPLIMNEWVEIERIFNPFGAFLLEIDTATNNGYDVHFLRLKMEICDRQRIPAQHKVPLRGVSGKRTLYDLGIIIEGPDTESLWAWARRKKGRPYPNGTEFGMNPTEQPPPDQNAPLAPPRANGNLLGTNAPRTQQGGGRTTRTTVDHIPADLKDKSAAHSSHTAELAPTFAPSAPPLPPVGSALLSTTQLPLVISLPFTDSPMGDTGNPSLEF